MKKINAILTDMLAAQKLAAQKPRAVKNAVDDFLARNDLPIACQLADIRDGEMFLAVDNAAAASRLRHLLPTLIKTVRQTHPEIVKARCDIRI